MIDVRGRRFSILGGARSGLAAARLLKARGGDVFLSDSAPAEKMKDAARVLEAIGVASEFGANSGRVLEAGTIVVSPGIRSDAPLIQEALARGISVVSELEAASWFCAAPIVAITGTNGKTTTTTLAGRMFSDARVASVVAGNIGTAFSEVADAIGPEGVAVVEVSSFQLDYVQSFRPRVAVILNITPDHLDRYDHKFALYIAAKERVFRNQGPGDVLIYNADDDVTRVAVERDAPPGDSLLPYPLRGVPEGGAGVAHGVMRAVLEDGAHDV
ncbi:MAG TPA: Mur ligase family protein, partial [Bacteroidota bacterium]|nr:Mur ligase family protein [Bacteroidota bacterium]